MPSAVESDVASADHPSALARLVGGLADRPVLSVAVVALAARLVFSVVSFVVHDAWLIPDESQYIDLAAHVADGRGAEAWYPFYGQSLYDSTWAFTAPIAFLYDLLSPTRLLGQLWALSFGVGTAAATTRLAMTVVAGRWAVGAGLLTALLPSQVLWSSVVLRESLVWFGLVGVALAVPVVVRRVGWHRVAGVLAVLLLLIFLGRLRPQTAVAAAWAVVIVAWLVPGRDRWQRAVALSAVALVAPMFASIGIGGIDLVEQALPMLGNIRGRMSLDAETAFVERRQVDVPSTTSSVPEQPGFGSSPPTTAPRDEPEIVQEFDGDTYEVEVGFAADVAALPRGFVATMLRPFPWERQTSAAMGVARAENLAWYALYAFAVAGVVLGRRRLDVLAFPFVVTGAVLVTSFITQGNLGTSFRHRGQVLWALALFATIAAERLASRRRAGTH